VDDGKSHVAPSGRKRRTQRPSSSFSSPSGDASASHEVVFPELSGCALVRELHVYGQLAAVAQPNQTQASGQATSEASNGPAAGVPGRAGGSSSSSSSRGGGSSSWGGVGMRLLDLSAGAAALGAQVDEDEVQHVGLGTRLMKRCEELAARDGFYKVAVISGVGVRAYYRKLGYELEPGGGEFMVKRLGWGFRLEHGKATRFAVAPLAAAGRWCLLQLQRRLRRNRFFQSAMLLLFFLAVPVLAAIALGARST